MTNIAAPDLTAARWVSPGSLVEGQLILDRLDYGSIIEIARAEAGWLSFMFVNRRGLVFIHEDARVPVSTEPDLVIQMVDGSEFRVTALPDGTNWFSINPRI
jgi:hypothetical protein